ncbi:prepilin peptidase [Actinoplanes sp. G11-F43]|uniref:prepilin peptidase n=1 Tax=Actinoplanes sp. G11-F43 TaxID=3424130 RepID=UPI003D338549
MIIIQVGVILSLIDLAVMRLPIPFVTGLAVVVGTGALAAASAAGNPRSIGSAVLGGLAVGGLYLLLALALPHTVGLGDVRLAAVLGGALGAHSWSAVLLGLTLPYLLAFPFARAQLRRGTEGAAYLPFGPFLIAGAVLASIVTGPLTT